MHENIYEKRNKHQALRFEKWDPLFVKFGGDKVRRFCKDKNFEESHAQLQCFKRFKESNGFRNHD